MSVTTTADENIREAKEQVSKAYKNLLNVLDEDTWGHGEFKAEYIDEIQKITVELLKIKRRL